MKRIVRSTLSSEAYAVSESVEDAIWVRFVLDDLRRKGETKSLRPVIEAQSDIPIVQCTDSDNLEKCVTMDAGVVKDKRLRIVIAMLRQTFNRAARIKLIWIPTHLMVADALTKIVCVAVLVAAIGCRIVKFPPPVRKTVFSLAAAGIPTAKGQEDRVVKYITPENQELSYMIYVLLFVGLVTLLGFVAGAAGGAAFARVQENRRSRHTEAKAKAKASAAAPVAEPPASECEHKDVTTKGINQWKLKKVCVSCGKVLEVVDTDRNTERKATAAAAAASASASPATRRRAPRTTTRSSAASSSTDLPPSVTTTPTTTTPTPAQEVTARGRAAMRSIATATRIPEDEEEAQPDEEPLWSDGSDSDLL